MSDEQPKPFEQNLSRIDAIVKELEGGVDLARATELFKEGKMLVRTCESQLKVAQEQIDRAMGEPAKSAGPSDG